MVKRIFTAILTTCKLIAILGTFAAILYFSESGPARPAVASVRTIEDEIRQEAPKYGVPVELALAILARESKGRRESFRYEPGQLAQGKAAAKRAGVPAWEIDQQAMQYSSSHCPLQVMGYHAPEFGLTWLDLYEPHNCVKVGLTVLGRAYKQSAASLSAKGFRPVVRGAACAYNAGQIDDRKCKEYADAVETRLINRALAKIL